MRSWSSSALKFVPKLGAYLVRRCQRGQPPREGIATAYGRWLVPLGEAGVHTNQYDRHAARSWIVVSRPADPVDGSDAYIDGLLDANGMEVLPPDYGSLQTVGDKLAFFRTLRDVRRGRHAYRCMRFDTGEMLPGEFDPRVVSGRSDNYLEAGLQDGGAGKHRGLLDLEGRRITGFEFEGVSAFHKKHKVAIVQKNGKCGLIDQRGKIILPIEYAFIGQKIAEGPPSFHGDSTPIFTNGCDAEGNTIPGETRVGIADKHGRVIVPPIWAPLAWQETFDREGRILVHRDGVLHDLYADGSISEPLGSLEGFRKEWSRQFRKKWLPSERQAPVPSSLPSRVDRKACAELIAILCRGNTNAREELEMAFNALLDDCAEQAAGEGAGDGGIGHTIYTVEDDQPATPFFRAFSVALRDEGIWMELDWKAVDEIAFAGAHMPDMQALKGFTWDGAAKGEDMQDGFTALDAFLGGHGHRLVVYETDGDYCMIGAVASPAFERCISLARELGIPLHGLERG